MTYAFHNINNTNDYYIISYFKYQFISSIGQGKISFNYTLSFLLTYSLCGIYVTAWKPGAYPLKRAMCILCTLHKRLFNLLVKSVNFPVKTLKRKPATIYRSPVFLILLSKINYCLIIDTLDFYQNQVIINC